MVAGVFVVFIYCLN